VFAVLCVTGDARAYDVRPDVTQVFDLDGTRLAALAASVGVPAAVAETPTAAGIAAAAREAGLPPTRPGTPASGRCLSSPNPARAARRPGSSAALSSRRTRGRCRFPTRGQLSALLSGANLRLLRQAEASDLPEASPQWRDRTAEVERELRRRYGDTAQLTEANAQSDRIGHLLRSGQLSCELMVLEQELPEELRHSG